MKVEITDATRDDVERLTEIYSAPHLYHTKQEASRYVGSFFNYQHINVLKANNTLAGVLFWRVESEKHHGIIVIDELWIEEEFRRKGLGERLLRDSIEAATSFFEKDGSVLRKVVVTTAEDNAPARRLYEKVGFHNCAVLKDLYGKGENELVYILTVNP
jgi:ribosomal protein S18 acetylase RimI-like enzyme